MTRQSRIQILTGHFGSGKTELAINLALTERQRHSKVAVADLDIINPYFRTRDVSALFQEHGVDLIAPSDRLKNADLPIVSADIYRYLHNPEYQLFVDAGGDKDGAMALGQYYNEWVGLEPEMYFILNASRPYVSTIEGALHTIQQIEYASRLKVTGIINNTNVGHATTKEDVLKGFKLCNEISELLKVPMLFTSVSVDLKAEVKELAKSNKVVLVQRFMRLPWAE